MASVPLVYAIGNKPTCSHSANGMPRSSAISRSLNSVSVVHADPSPRDRSASMNDHSVGITEPQRLDCQNTDVRSACAPAPSPSVRPATMGTHSTGTSCRWSRRWNTLRAMR